MSLAQYTLVWSQWGQTYRNVGGLFHPDVGFPLDDAIIYMYNALTTAMEDWSAAMANSLTLEAFTIREVTGSPPYAPQVETPVGITGAATEQGLPGPNAYTLAFITGNPSIRRGHWNVPGPHTGALSAGAPTAGAITAIQDGWDGFIDGMSGGDYLPVVLRLNAIGTETAGQPVTGRVVRPVFGVQGSRKIGTGE